MDARAASQESAGGLRLHPCRHGNGALWVTSHVVQKAGDAAVASGTAVGEVNPLVAIEIDGVTAQAARHELRDAQGAGEEPLIVSGSKPFSRLISRNCSSSVRKKSARRGYWKASVASASYTPKLPVIRP